MCKHCTEHEKLRDTPLDANELAWLRRLREMDPAKYPALLPAYIKTHLRLGSPPERHPFKPGEPPVYPGWIAGCGKWQTREEAAALRQYPVFVGQSVADYVGTFETLNRLRKGEPS